MSGTNDFLPVATGGTPNVVTQLAYAGSTEQVQGFGVGEIPPSGLFNKMVRQQASISAAIAQLAANVTGDNLVDDGNQANLIATLAKMMGVGVYNPLFSTANKYFCIPNTRFFFQWQSYSVTPGSTSNVPAGMSWGQSGAIGWTKLFDNMYATWCSPVITTNGNLRNDWHDIASNSVYVNTATVATSPLTGIVVALCYKA